MSTTRRTTAKTPAEPAAKLPRRPRTASSGTKTAGRARAEPKRTAPPAANTGPREPAQAATNPDGDQSATERAEVLFDELGQRVGIWALLAGQQLRRFGARAREEAEDILAEAQSLRRGQ